MTFNLLGLPEYRVAGVPEELEHDFHFQVEIAKDSPRICPHCNGNDVVVHGYLKEPVVIKDLPVRGKRVGLYVNPQRFRCRSSACEAYRLKDHCERTHHSPALSMANEMLRIDLKFGYCSYRRETLCMCLL